MATRTRVVASPAPASTGAPRARVKASAEPAASTAYFADAGLRSGLEFVSTGCIGLDLVLGGGYVLGRMTNIIGDKSTGKTLLAIEGGVNFLRKFPDGVIRYVEAESAFDRDYAAALGLPVDVIEWPQLVDAKGETDRTVEWVHDDIVDTIKRMKGRPCLYIVDSLDALSDRAEMERGISEGSYGANKAKKLGELFRRLVGEIEKSRMLLLVISQIRDKIGVTFGETKMRAGGHAMDFYATHCLWLAQIGQIKKTVGGIERPIGVDIRAKCKKNKVGLPFREIDFPLFFGYGVDDITSSVEWLIEAKREAAMEELGLSKTTYKTRVTALRNRGGPELRELRQRLDVIMRREWAAVESNFLPVAGKY